MAMNDTQQPDIGSNRSALLTAAPWWACHRLRICGRLALLPAPQTVLW